MCSVCTYDDALTFLGAEKNKRMILKFYKTTTTNNNKKMCSNGMYFHLKYRSLASVFLKIMKTVCQFHCIMWCNNMYIQTLDHVAETPVTRLCHGVFVGVFLEGMNRWTFYCLAGGFSNPWDMYIVWPCVLKLGVGVIEVCTNVGCPCVINNIPLNQGHHLLYYTEYIN